jgi:hypothetical protein
MAGEKVLQNRVAGRRNDKYHVWIPGKETKMRYEPLDISSIR